MALGTYVNIAKAIVNNKTGRIELPNMCTFIITWRCNLRCFMCDVWKKQDHDEMSLEDIRKVFKQIPHLDSLRITGGEPFLHRDLTEITRIILEETAPTVIHVTTAGIMTDRILDYVRTVGSRRLHIKLSIDAVGERHDEIRGAKGLYDKAMRTLRALVELRSQYGFYVGVNQTITDRNWDHIEPLRREMDKLGVSVHYAIATDHYTLYRLNTAKEKDIPDMKAVSMSAFTSEQLSTIFQQLESRDGIRDIPEWLVQRYYIRGLKNRLLKNVESPKPRCVELHNHLRLMPNGDVMTCIYYPTVVGNLRNQSLSEIWFGDAIKPQREIVRQCPGCWAGCEAKPNAIYTGDIVRAL
ncbi:MAG: radical SAM protein [Chloroflexi bacterium]|nr:radical SAM protein [Chloroflexota bacterium]MCL5950286.1 radical SAM protein [Chloroflexota bacterium]